MLLSARWIVPISSPPLENGWIRIENGIISTVGASHVTHHASDDSVIALSDCALFPGLINAHAHLEFGRSDHPHESFAAWVQSVQAAQNQNTSQQCTQRWQQNTQRLLKTGTTTVVNHCNQLPPFLTTPSPHIHHVCEIVGSSPKRAAESYREAARMQLELLEGHASVDAVVSPTSPYAVSPLVWEEFLKQRNHSDLVSIHIKESAEEEQLYTKGAGPLATLVKQRGGLLWQSDPITWLREKNVLAPKCLLVHGNYLTDQEISTLQGTGASVIHCPGSHAYFGHQRFPLEALRKQGINVGLGTDSLASNQDLSMLREMRLLQENYPELSEEDIVRMATLDGAKAIGQEENLGSLEVGKWADVIAVKVHKENESPWNAILAAEQVEMVIIGGKKCDP